MRKTGYMILTIVMLLTTVSCSSKGNTTNSKTLYQKGLELTGQLDMIAESKDYVSLFSGSEALASQTEKIGNVDFSKPVRVFKISGLATAVLDTYLDQSGIKLDQKIKDIVQTRFGASIPTMINSKKGAEFVAATSMVTVNDSFLYKGLKKQVTYLYVFDHEYSTMVIFQPYEDDIVATSASVVFSDAFTADTTVDDVTNYFKDDMDIVGIEISEVTK